MEATLWTKPTDAQQQEAALVGKFYKAIYFQGELRCYKLWEKPKVSNCNCTKK